LRGDFQAAALWAHVIQLGMPQVLLLEPGAFLLIAVLPFKAWIDAKRSHHPDYSQIPVTMGHYTHAKTCRSTTRWQTPWWNLHHTQVCVYALNEGCGSVESVIYAN
jgi:hypothetical protein